MVSEIERARSHVRRRRVSFQATKGSLRLTVVKTQTDCIRHFRKRRLCLGTVVQLLNSETNSVEITWYGQPMNTHGTRVICEMSSESCAFAAPLGLILRSPN